MAEYCCPVCTSRRLKIHEVSERVVLAACPECGSVVTINRFARPGSGFKPPEGEGNDPNQSPST